MKLTWELFATGTGRHRSWRWRARARNRRIVAASSESYRRRIDAARNAIVFNGPAELLQAGVVSVE